MIIILNGPLGIGKSETAWGLLYRLEPGAMLDVDHLAAIHPFDYYEPADLEYARELCALLVRRHRERGLRNFVINWVYESAEELSRLKEALAPFGLPIHAYRLTCSAEALVERIRRRGRPDVEGEERRGIELLGILERAGAAGDLGKAIDTTELSVEQVVERILADAVPGKGVPG
jgi:hypothetical protein